MIMTSIRCQTKTLAFPVSRIHCGTPSNQQAQLRTAYLTEMTVNDWCRQQTAS
jgi:hypothetical protein